MTEDAHLRCNRVPTPEYLKAWPDVTNRCPPTKRESPSAACVSEKHTQSQRTSFNSAFIPLSRAGIWTLAFLHRNQKGVGLVWHAVLDRCCPYEEVGCFPFFPLPLLEFCNETSAFCFNSPISGLSTSSCQVAPIRQAASLPTKTLRPWLLPPFRIRSTRTKHQCRLALPLSNRPIQEE